MKNSLIHWALIIFGCLAVLYPLWVRNNSIDWTSGQLASNFFPFFGLAAVALLWLHAISGAFEPWLRKHINFDRFVAITASIILVCLIAHPLLAIASFHFNLNNLFASYGFWYIFLGILGWLLLITYDITKPLRKYHTFFAKHWRKVLIISNIGFLITFFHSLNIGSDLQSGPLRYLWIFWGISAAICIFYTYAIKKP